MGISSGNEIILDNGSASAPAIQFSSHPQHGIYQESDSVKVAVGGSQVMAISSSGVSFTGSVISSGPTIMTRANVASAATINSLSSASGFVKLTGSTATTLNGIAAGVNGQVLILANLTGQALTISNASASGASGEKITTMTGADVATTGNGSAIFIYDTDSSPATWLLISVAL